MRITPVESGVPIIRPFAIDKHVVVAGLNAALNVSPWCFRSVKPLRTSRSIGSPITAAIEFSGAATTGVVTTGSSVAGAAGPSPQATMRAALDTSQRRLVIIGRCGLAFDFKRTDTLETPYPLRPLSRTGRTRNYAAWRSARHAGAIWGRTGTRDGHVLCLPMKSDEAD